MQQRLDWIVKPPEQWCHWEPVRGGMQAHQLLRERYPQAECTIYEPVARREAVAQDKLGSRWWQLSRWKGAAVQMGAPADASMDMLWANMLLHTAADPQTLIERWHKALKVDGYVMFSCLGPDTVQQLHRLYAELGWGPAGHTFTDMHDWGDMLVHSGFAEPVMDMERITLTFATPQRLLQELRELGRNLHPGRFCRSAWPWLEGRAAAENGGALGRQAARWTALADLRDRLWPRLQTAAQAASGSQQRRVAGRHEGHAQAAPQHGFAIAHLSFSGH